MGLAKVTTALLAVIGSSVAAPTSEARQAAEGTKYCDASSTICYSEYSASGIAFRIAIPDTATEAPFPVLLQIVAPTAAAWAGIAWGGAMANNPLTVAWPNGDSVVVSSRFATGHVLPSPYADASYTVLPSSMANDTHWQLDTLCDGCSKWAASSLDPAGTAVPLAWAMSAQPVAEPASNTSRFGIHSGKGQWMHDLSSAKLADFDALVAKLNGGGDAETETDA